MNYFIKEVLKEGKKSLESDDVPVGAIIVQNNKIIGRGHNTREKEQVVTKHAEINALEEACKNKKSWYLNDCEMYVTLEPCPMCMNAIKQARIKKVNYCTERSKVDCIKEPEIERCFGCEEAKKMLQDFFKTKRNKKQN